MKKRGKYKKGNKKIGLLLAIEIQLHIDLTVGVYMTMGTCLQMSEWEVISNLSVYTQIIIMCESKIKAFLTCKDARNIF